MSRQSRRSSQIPTPEGNGIILAARIGVHACDGGCPVVALRGPAGNIVAEAHLLPENVEPFIAGLREAAAVAAARRRPLS